MESSNLGNLLHHDGLGRGEKMVQGGISFDRAKTSTRGTLTEMTDAIVRDEIQQGPLIRSMLEGIHPDRHMEDMQKAEPHYLL